ncbi:MAG: 4Fe-4S binding protein [Acidobacteriia bacterium]|nr:4Fe-4S binding protein [Terriglobia bacterium]
MKRKIIRIDEEKCNGCGLCLPGCPEGALQIINGKARLISDLFCDGLGACLGHCPEGAITIEEREAVPYDERQVIAGIARQGRAVIDAHLKHLREHNEMAFLQQALEYLREQGLIASPGNAGSKPTPAARKPGGCPGSQVVSFGTRNEGGDPRQTGLQPSRLTHWPIQLHLISPQASHFHGSDLLLAADCVAFALGGFHEDHLKGKTLAIACPKLDNGQEIYLEKLTSLVDVAEVKSLTVMIMQVPCCAGLLHLARRAVEQAGRKVPIHFLVVGLRGEILQQGSL